MDEDGKYDYELVRFVFDLRTEDPLRMLVRAQAHIEQSLRQFILAHAPFPRHAALEQLDFDGTTRLAFVLGLDTSLLQLLVLKASETMINHDSEVVGACSVD
jgi:hypothetical protein